MADDLNGMPLHAEIQTAIGAMIDRGEDPAAVLNAVLDVALAGKTALEGPRPTAREVYVAAFGLARMADEQDRRAAAPKH